MNLANYELEQEVQAEHKSEDSVMTGLYENNNVSCPRKGEDAKQTRFRANRLFSSSSVWYFSTREGKDQGPFLTKEDAQNAIARFISEVSL